MQNFVELQIFFKCKYGRSLKDYQIRIDKLNDTVDDPPPIPQDEFLNHFKKLNTVSEEFTQQQVILNNLLNSKEMEKLNFNELDFKVI
jgi:hypothetical protein